MTFIELCQRVRQESGISGDGPVSVLNQKSILQKVVEWVRQSDIDIQRLQLDWLFMWRMKEITLVEDINEYDANSLTLLNMRELLTLDIAGEEVYFYTWDDFKREKYHQSTDKGKPTAYTIKPDGLIMLYPTPAIEYTATAEYSLKPQPMVNDVDVSLIPENYHDIILHKALMYYASHEEDQSLYQVSESRYEMVLSEMAANCLPRITLAGGIR